MSGDGHGDGDIDDGWWRFTLNHTLLQAGVVISRVFLIFLIKYVQLGSYRWIEVEYHFMPNPNPE